MWMLIGPAILGVGSLIKKLFSSKLKKNQIIKFSILEKNFIRLKIELNKIKNEKKILLIGQPGAGKSTLLLKLTNMKCYPHPIINQATDATNWVENLMSDFFTRYKNYYFVDTPGYGTIEHPASSYIRYFPFTNFDVVLFIIKDKIHISDIYIFNKIINLNNKIFFIRCFAENLNQEEKSILINDYIKHFNDFKKIDELFFISNRSNSSILNLQLKLGIEKAFVLYFNKYMTKISNFFNHK